MSIAPPLVLLVEDFDDAREMYADYLEFSGLRVAGAADAVRGLEMAQELQPAIILMDAALPGLSGWDAIAELKANPRTRHIPVIMLTGHVLGDARERAIAAGADGFIAKPCLPDELTRHILQDAQGRLTTTKNQRPKAKARPTPKFQGNFQAWSLLGLWELGVPWRLAFGFWSLSTIPPP